MTSLLVRTETRLCMYRQQTFLDDKAALTGVCTQSFQQLFVPFMSGRLDQMNVEVAKVCLSSSCHTSCCQRSHHSILQGFDFHSLCMLQQLWGASATLSGLCIFLAMCDSVFLSPVCGTRYGCIVSGCHQSFSCRMIVSSPATHSRLC